jgi:type II secretory ATPase GspE/PulE/Tfp pilus assembly ATPase PilB-like protein
MKLKFDWNLPNPTGCEICWYDWYIGRIAALELFEVHDDIKNVIMKWKTTIDMYANARASWFLTIKEDAYIKMLKWYTTLDEIRRAI